MGEAKATGVAINSTDSNGVKRGSMKRSAATNAKDSGWKRPKLAEKTDTARWRMLDDEGRHTWHYLEDDEAVKEWPQSYADKWYLGLPMVSIPSVVAAVARRVQSLIDTLCLIGLTHTSRTQETSRCGRQRSRFF